MNPIISTKKAVIPIVLIIVASIITIIYNIALSPRASGIDTIVFYSFLAVITFGMVLVFQRFIDSPRIHLPLSIGWGMVFISAIEKLNAECLDTQIIENELIFTAILGIGVGISAVGFYFLMAHNRQQDQLRDQQHKMIELYTSLMSHDAGNDLQAILGYIEAALMVPEGCSARTIELLEAAQASALRMTSLIKAFKPEMSNAENRLLSILEMSALQAEKAHIGLSISIEASEVTKDIQVAGGSMLQMAFANLFRNSAEYAGQDPIVSINVTKDDSDAVITIRDNGPGIQGEHLNRLFQRGGSRDGHGFGLYLTKQIVAACSGSIELVDSEMGAEFRIVLPLNGS